MNSKPLKDYWNKKFSKQNIFGEDPTDFAKDFLSFAKDNSIKSVLDLGCGQGRDSIFFDKKGLDVTGLDISEEAIKFLKENYNNVDWVLGNFGDLSIFGEDLFDGVFSNLSFQYSSREEYKIYIRGINRILKPGGYLFCTLKNLKDKNFGRGREVEKNVFEVHGGVLRHFFEKEEIEEALKDFEIIKLEEDSHVMPDSSDSSNNLNPSAYWKVIARKI